jgi:hypothetical protein
MEDPQILGTKEQNLVSKAIWSLGFVHPCFEGKILRYFTQMVSNLSYLKRQKINLKYVKSQKGFHYSFGIIVTKMWLASIITPRDRTPATGHSANHWPGYHTRGVPFHNRMRSVKLRLEERITNLLVYTYNTSRVLHKHVTTFTMQLQFHVQTVLQKKKYRTETNWPRSFGREIMFVSLLVDKLLWFEVQIMMKRWSQRG